MLKPISIEAFTLPDAWFQAIYAVVNHGREFKIDKGSFAGQTRLELDWLQVHIKAPYLRCHEGLPLLPEIPEGMDIPAPVSKRYLREYLPYLLTGQKKDGEQYSYGDRLHNVLTFQTQHPSENAYAEPYYFSQVDKVIATYQSEGFRNNQMVLQVAKPSDILLEDPPCLRSIDTRIQDNKLHFFLNFRSNDLWSGFPANLAGISVLQEFMAAEIGVDQGEMIYTCKGAHLYFYAVELAKVRIHFDNSNIVKTMCKVAVSLS
jgi:thymidylate synthase